MVSVQKKLTIWEGIVWSLVAVDDYVNGTNAGLCSIMCTSHAHIPTEHLYTFFKYDIEVNMRVWMNYFLFTCLRLWHSYMVILQLGRPTKRFIKGKLVRNPKVVLTPRTENPWLRVKYATQKPACCLKYCGKRSNMNCMTYTLNIHFGNVKIKKETLLKKLSLCKRLLELVNSNVKGNMEVTNFHRHRFMSKSWPCG